MENENSVKEIDFMKIHALFCKLYIGELKDQNSEWILSRQTKHCDMKGKSKDNRLQSKLKNRSYTLSQSGLYQLAMLKAV